MTGSVAERVRAMAEGMGVTYVPAPTDALAEAITRHAGDEGGLDATARLIVALRRGGHLDGPEATSLHAEHIRECRGT